jgi:mannonate dehydratase
MALEQTWRWFGPKDPVSLQEIKQCGATGIVNALHQIPYGELWTIEDILQRKKMIEDAGLRWSVVESVPVHEDIKKRTGKFKEYIENYKQTIRNLGKCRLDTICYNFMPVLDWSRTELESTNQDGSLVSEYKQVLFTVFELFILKQTGDEANYSEEQIKEAKEYFKNMSQQDIENLKRVVLLSLPGTDEPVSIEYLRNAIKEYKGISREKLKEHLKLFIKEIIPVAEESGIRMAIHPDDPPRPVFGLPRIVSTLQDLKEIVEAYDSPANGITLCTGSLGAGSFNNCPLIAKELSHRINFAHLRNVERDDTGNFRENYVFEGDVDIPAVMKELILEEERRKNSGRKDWQIPLRPDHGNQMLGDVGRKFYPGYSLYGRMKNLAELRGLEIGIRNVLSV